MPPQKQREKVDKDIDKALDLRIAQFQKQWEQFFGEPITWIEMSKLFGEFGTLDMEKMKKVRDANGIRREQLQVKEKANPRANLAR